MNLLSMDLEDNGCALTTATVYYVRRQLARPRGFADLHAGPDCPPHTAAALERVAGSWQGYVNRMESDIDAVLTDLDGFLQHALALDEEAAAALGGGDETLS